VRKLALLLAVSMVCSCSSVHDPVAPKAPEEAEWKKEMKEGGRKVAAVTVRGAEVVGDSVGTAYHGVKNGFEEPELQAFGPYPRDYASTIRKHMLRFEGVKETASFQFAKPVKGYLNKGILRGGEIEWQGWVVDVAIAAKTPLGQPEVDEYVVRMKDGDIVEVIEKSYAGAIRRITDQPVAVPAAPQR